ncbi:phage tail protein [Brucella intermedia]|uniref:phage tail protein n=1 Tax=Brucella intermedia TaxID=94625 RepID=UPI002361B2F8|nr:phage tail protein [Brucella intermedia]
MFMALLALIIILTTTPAEAAPVVGAIVGFGVKLLGAFGGILFKAAFAIGSSLLQQYLQRRAQKKSAVSGVTLELKMGDDLPLSLPVGERGVAGRRKYAGTYGKDDGTPNAFAVDVIEISSLPSFAGPQGIESLWIDDQLCTILWNEPDPSGRGYPIKEFRKGSKDSGWIWYLDGSQTTANPYLLSKFGNHPERPFLSSMVGRGVQAIILTWRQNRDLQLGGSLPSAIVEPKPMRFYDLRFDSTNGGNGPQRWNDPSTWLPTRNPPIIIYNIIRGIYYGDEWIYGGQNISAHRLPPASWIAAANECDRQVMGDKGMEPQFRCGYEIYVDVEPLEVIEELRLACLGRLVEVGGMVKLQVGAPGSAVYSITDDSIVVTREQDLDPFPSISSTYNGISATYPERAERWTMKDAPERRNLELERDDGNRSLAQAVAFEAVPFSGQVQRSSNTLVEENRRFVSHVFYLPPSAWVLEPGVDVITWTSERNGYQNKKFYLTRAVGYPGMIQQVVLREIDPTDYTPPNVILPPVIGWIGPITVPPQPMYGWRMEAVILNDDLDRPRRPSVRVSCAPDQDDVARVHVQLRVKGTEQIVFDSDSTPYGAPYAWNLMLNLMPNTWFEGRGRFVPYSNREMGWSEWIAVKTDDVRMGPLDIYPFNVDNFNSDLKEMWKEQNGSIRYAFDELERLGKIIADMGAEGVTEQASMRREVAVQSNNIKASFKEQIYAAVGPGSAIVSRIEAMEITVNETVLSAVNSMQLKYDEINGKVEASGTIIQGLNVQVGKFSANGMFRTYVAANESGSTSRIGISAASSAGDATGEAALFIESVNGAGRIIIDAEGFYVTNRTQRDKPMAYINGRLTLQLLDVGRFRAGIGESWDSRFLINFGNGSIEWFQ